VENGAIDSLSLFLVTHRMQPRVSIPRPVRVLVSGFRGVSLPPRVALQVDLITNRDPARRDELRDGEQQERIVSALTFNTI